MTKRYTKVRLSWSNNVPNGIGAKIEMCSVTNRDFVCGSAMNVRRGEALMVKNAIAYANKIPLVCPGRERYV